MRGRGNDESGTTSDERLAEAPAHTVGVVRDETQVVV